LIDLGYEEGTDLFEKPSKKERASDIFSSSNSEDEEEEDDDRDLLNEKVEQAGDGTNSSLATLTEADIIQIKG